MTGLDSGSPSMDRPRFIDLFAGIGGFRMALERAGGRCVFSSEIDAFSRKTYAANFGDEPAGDIREVQAKDVPDHEILAAGFPCQPFSIAGVSKKGSLGREHGFKDMTQGTLFFDIARILAEKEPAMVFLENVKNLKSHDKGRTFSIVLSTLQELGYTVFHSVLDARYYVPQHRERIYLIGFHRKSFEKIPFFRFPQPSDQIPPRLASILDPDDSVPANYTISDRLWQWHQDYAEKHRGKGNGFGFGLVGPEDTARTLSARYYKDGSEILIRQKEKNPRRLTPRECARLMGFPDDFQIPVSDTQAYRQFGNSVVMPLVHDIACELMIYASHVTAVPEPGRAI
ncbi:MAG: DNA (cytosine-5-)-methyltransferase [Leptospiraceae bacterium]|nr:DNA (cytosine-5-)-methyltransferase [Leptospiraceae bacterium]